MSSKRPKLLIVGLDGATYDVIRPWAGELPALNRFLDAGAHGPLRSAVPPITAPAWTSFMTGMNPGKHGLYNFIEPQPGSYGVRYSNARSRRTRSLWQLLSDAGLSVGTVNVPMTYPPEEVAGYVVSGLDAPESSTAITHPPELYTELRSEFGEVSPQFRHLGYLNSDERRDHLLDRLREIDAHYVRLTRHLIETRPTDVVMVVFTSTDTIQHFFFHYLDPAHPQHPGEAAPERYRNAVRDVYRRLDSAIAELSELVAPDGLVAVVSDHGFRSTSGRVVHMNQLLAELGLLHYRREPAPKRALNRLLRGVDRLVRSNLTPTQKGRLAALLPSLRRKWEKQLIGLTGVDWARTRAFCYENLTVPPSIWLNRKGDFPHGIVEPGEAYDELVATLTAELLAVPDPVTGKPLITAVHRREELYQGPFLAHAPDLTPAWWDGVGFVSQAGRDFPAAVEMAGPGPLGAGDWGGTHAIDGIVGLAGAGVRPGAALDGADITDVVPTLLYWLGLPIPEDIDGAVRRDAFTAELLASRGEPRTGPPSGQSGGADATYSDAEAREVEQRLRDLGYLS